VTSDTELPDKETRVEGVLETDGTITLKIDDKIVATGKTDSALSVYPAGVVETGKYTKENYPAIGDYETIETFPGTLGEVLITFGE
jgi:hypothetical protein